MNYYWHGSGFGALAFKYTGFETIRIHDVYRVCTRSSNVCKKVTTNTLNPYVDHDFVRVSEVFTLRHIQIPHSTCVKNRPCVKCRRVSINIGAIYNTVYGILSRRAEYDFN